MDNEALQARLDEQMQLMTKEELAFLDGLMKLNRQRRRAQGFTKPLSFYYQQTAMNAAARNSIKNEAKASS